MGLFSRKRPDWGSCTEQLKYFTPTHYPLHTMIATSLSYLAHGMPCFVPRVITTLDAVTLDAEPDSAAAPLGGPLENHHGCRKQVLDKKLADLQERSTSLPARNISLRLLPHPTFAVVMQQSPSNPTPFPPNARPSFPEGQFNSTHKRSGTRNYIKLLLPAFGWGVAVCIDPRM